MIKASREFLQFREIVKIPEVEFWIHIAPNLMLTIWAISEIVKIFEIKFWYDFTPIFTPKSIWGAQIPKSSEIVFDPEANIVPDFCFG